MKRRDFLRVSGLSTPVLLNGLSLSTLAKSRLFSTIDGDSDRILVLIQLTGGNDGLNTIIPMDMYDRLQAVRTDIMVPENSVINIDQDLAMHGSMESMHELYTQQQLKIVQGVAYPNQNRSHFRSTDIWTSGSPATEVWIDGWLGRYFQNRHPEFPTGYPNADCPDPFAITVGSLVSATCQGITGNFSMAISDVDSLNPISEGATGSLPDTPYGDELMFLREAIRQTNAYAEQITNAADAGTTSVSYNEDNPLAQSLKTVAQLISGGLQTRVYVVSLGGFDTHAGQVNENDSNAGMHADLLQTVSEAVFSFQTDIQNQGLQDRVLGMTFSEFGRQIAQNDSFGTDHGTAAPLFLFGNCVDPAILGHNAEIPELVDPQDGVAMQYDFRDIYGSVLVDWFDVEEAEVREILHPEFIKLPLLDQNCLMTTSTSDPTAVDQLVDMVIRPQPVRGTAYIDLELRESAEVDLRIYDSVGKELATLISGRVDAGLSTYSHDCHRFPAGNYYCRLRVGRRHMTQLMLVI